MLNYIGKYKILSVIGKGGMGAVYHGFDEKIERDVAIKIIHPHLISEDTKIEYLERFTNEAKAAARCSHSNIVTVLEYGETKNIPYLVMEYVKGFSLHEYINVKKDIPIKSILQIIIQILKALQFAHDKGVVHRDIKPANILLLSGNYVKITDFGIAHLPASELTQIGYILGSPFYMSPEQALGKEVDHRADLFSVGVIFAQLLTRSVYPNISTSRLEKKEGLPPKIRIDFSKVYPSILVPLLQKSLSVDVNKRFQSADEFIMTLRQTCARSKKQPIKSVTETKIEEAQFLEIKKQLSEYVGPISDKLVKMEMTQTNDINTMIQHLSTHIKEKKDRDCFVTQILQSCQTKITPASTNKKSSESAENNNLNIDSQAFDNLCRDYSKYVGPLAKHMIKKAMKQGNESQKLIRILAKAIPNEQEKATFLKSWIQF